MVGGWIYGHISMVYAPLTVYASPGWRSNVTPAANVCLFGSRSEFMTVPEWSTTFDTQPSFVDQDVLGFSWEAWVAMPSFLVYGCVWR